MTRIRKAMITQTGLKYQNDTFILLNDLSIDELIDDRDITISRHTVGGNESNNLNERIKYVNGLIEQKQR